MNILVAEDDIEIRKLLEEIIKTLGDYNIVDSGGAALDAFEDAWKAGLPYDVILLDINIPDISGIEVLKNIRHLEKRKKLSKKMQVQIIMMTGLSDKHTVKACFESGCNDYIVKPFNTVAIIETVAIVEKLKQPDASLTESRKK